MEKLNGKIKAFVAINYKKWEDYGDFAHFENIHQFEKWWYDDFLFTLPEPDENGENYFCINEIYSPEDFFEGDINLFSMSIKAVHDYYTEHESIEGYEGVLHTRNYDPINIMTEYASVYVVNNSELMNLYLPLHLMENKNTVYPNPV